MQLEQLVFVDSSPMPRMWIQTGDALVKQTWGKHCMVAGKDGVSGRSYRLGQEVQVDPE